MNFSVHPFSMIILMGGVHGLLNTAILIYRGIGDRRSVIFGALVFLLSLACLRVFLQETFPEVLSQLAIPLLYQFAWGPLLLLYTRSTLYRKFRMTKGVLLLFVPSFVFDFLSGLLLPWMPMDDGPRSIIGLVIDLLACIHFSYFLVRSLTILRAYRKGVYGFYSNVSSDTGRWLVSLYIVFGAMLVGWLFYMFATVALRSFELPFAGMKTYYPVYIWFSVSIYYLVYKWYRSPAVQMIDRPSKQTAPKRDPIYDPQDLRERVQRKNLYRDPKLTLKKLASSMKLNINDLSQTINSGLDQSFNDFINEMRVDEVKRKMEDPKYAHLSQLGMALESGFNSKATYNRAFKKFTGMSPSSYQKGLPRK